MTICPGFAVGISAGSAGLRPSSCSYLLPMHQGPSSSGPAKATSGDILCQVPRQRLKTSHPQWDVLLSSTRPDPLDLGGVDPYTGSPSYGHASHQVPLPPPISSLSLPASLPLVLLLFLPPSSIHLVDLAFLSTCTYFTLFVPRVPWLSCGL